MSFENFILFSITYMNYYLLNKLQIHEYLT